MTAPAYRVEVAWGSTWSTPPGSRTWTDITSRVLDRKQRVRVRRGRSSSVEEIRPGTIGMLLANQDRALDPENAASPHVGEVLPGVPIRLVADLDGGDEDVIVAQVDDWPQRFDRSAFQLTVPLHATDAMEKLARTGTPSSVYAIEVTADAPKLWWRMNETAGSSMMDSSGNGYHGVYTDGTTIRSTRHPNQWEAEPGLHWDGEHYAEVPDFAARVQDVPLVVEVLVRHDSEALPLLNTSLLLRNGSSPANGFQAALRKSDGIWIFTSDLTSVSRLSALTAGNFADGSEHHVVFVRTAGGAFVYVDGVDVTATTAVGAGYFDEGLTVAGENPSTTGSVTGGWRGLMADLAIYDTDITTSRIDDHAAAFLAPWSGDTSGQRVIRILELAGVPSTLYAVDTGLSLLGPARLGKPALELIQAVEGAEQGSFFIDRSGIATFHARHRNISQGSLVTFSDDGADTPYGSWDRDSGAVLIRNRVQGSRDGGGRLTVEDEPSKDQYGPRSDRADLRDLPLATDAQVKALIEFRLATGKDPHARIPRIRIPLHSPKVDAAVILALDLGDTVTFESTYEAMGITTDPVVIVETIDGIDHEIGGGEWWVELSVTPAQPVDIFVLDESLLDGPAVLTF